MVYHIFKVVAEKPNDEFETYQWVAAFTNRFLDEKIAMIDYTTFICFTTFLLCPGKPTTLLSGTHPCKFKVWGSTGAGLVSQKTRVALITLENKCSPINMYQSENFRRDVLDVQLVQSIYSK